MLYNNSCIKAPRALSPAAASLITANVRAALLEFEAVEDEPVLVPLRVVGSETLPLQVFFP